MSVTSLNFLLFLFGGMIIYYILPKKLRWGVLLCLSVVFYCIVAVPYTIIFVLLSVLWAYVGTIYITQDSNDKVNKDITYYATFIGIGINVLLWLVLKGNELWLVIPGTEPLRYASAMGMGYYTAQLIGYMVECRWGLITPEKNFFKLLLFTMFFPQMITGPISKYSEFESVFRPNSFSYENLTAGAKRILWGYFKKLVIATRLTEMVNIVWGDTDKYAGFPVVLAVLVYPCLFYADFSGGMDIVLGAAKLFGVTLPENFKCPFFSKSISEFWRRWHMTLGRFARDIVFFPFQRSSFMIKLSSKCRKSMKKRWARFVPNTISLALLWLVMGIWHGSYKHIVGVSAWYFLVITLGELLKPLFDSLWKKLNISNGNSVFMLFRYIRTYLIFTIGSLFFAGEDVADSFFRLKLFFSSVFHMHNEIGLSEFITQMDRQYWKMSVALIGIAIMLIADIIEEKKGNLHTAVNSWPLPVRYTLWIILFLAVSVLGIYGKTVDVSTFIYEVF